MTTPQPYSDLIHLFLDGEATETERSVLFSALKDTPSLQEEFASAVHVRGALASDAMKLQPPAFLEGRIMQKAGLLAAELPAAAYASTTLHTVGSAGLPLLKTGLLIALGAATGVATIIGIQQYPKFSKLGNHAPSQTIERIRPDAVNAPIAQLLTEAPSEISPSVATTTSHDHVVSANFTSHFARNASAHSTTHSTSVHRDVANRISEPEISDHSANVADVTTIPTTKAPATTTDIPVTKQPIADHSPEASQLVSNAVSETPSASVPMAIISLASSSTSNDIIIGEEGAERNPLRVNEFRSTHVDWVDNLSVQINTLINAGLSTGRDVHGDNHTALNLAASINYDLSARWTIGVGVGNESFPIYLKHDNSYRPTYSITWLGASVGYTINTEPIFGGAHLFVSTLAGMSDPGPMLRPEVGVKYDLAANATMSVSATDMFVFFNEDGATNSGNKFGISVGASYRF